MFWLFSPGETLSERVIRGGAWAFALRIAELLFGLVRTVILARLLAPSDFGLFAIALLTMTAVETFSQTGLQAALVQKKGEVTPYLDTAWTLQLLRGVVVASILFAVAPYVAAFFDEPNAGPLLRVLGLSVVFRGLTNIGAVYFQRDLEFRKQAAATFAGTFVDLGVAVPAALLLRSPWALMLGLLAGDFARTVASYAMHPYRPRPRFQAARARELSSFGLWIWGVGVSGFLARQADKALVGTLLGTAALGFYGVASRLADLVVADIGRIVSGVTFPAYSKLQDERERLKDGFLATLEVVLFLALPVGITTIAFASDLISILLGERWLPMAGALQLLTVSGLVRGALAPFGALFRAVGKANVELWLTLVRGVVAVSLAIPLSQIWHITGVAGASLLGVGITLFAWWRLSLGIVRIDASALLGRLGPTLLAAGAMLATVSVLKAFVAVEGPVRLGSVVFLGAAAYMIPLVAFWRHSTRGPLRHIGTPPGSSRARR